MFSFYQKEVGECFHQLHSSAEGLSEPEAKKRLNKYGYNKLTEKKKETLLHKLFSQFTDVLVIVLIAAGLISFLMGDKSDALVIFIIVLINASIGFWQEFKAERSLEALKKMVKSEVEVIRKGKIQKIDAKFLVPGDIIALQEGDSIPADARIIEAVELKTNESALTGESIAKPKIIESIAKKISNKSDMHNMLFMGTVVTHGHGKAVVDNTGMNTEFGKIAKLTTEVKEEKSPLQKELNHTGKFIARTVLIICILVFVTGVVLGQSWFDMLFFAIALAVAGVPEGLPATVTIALALGVSRMVKNNAIIRKLSSVETLGSTTVICSDKTGTLTKNEMTVKKILVNNNVVEVTGEGYDIGGGFLKNGKDYKDSTLELLLKIGYYCNDASFSEKHELLGDPTEGSLVISAQKYGLKNTTPRIDEIPFDSERKMMSTIHEIDKKRMVFVKGASGKIIDACTHIVIDGKKTAMTDAKRKALRNTVEQFASEALRVMGFAYKEIHTHEKKDHYEKDLIFVGLQGMIDPPRPEVAEAVKMCKEAHMRIFIVTGDYGNTAKAIAKQVGIADKDTQVIKGSALEHMSDTQLKKILKAPTAIFARVAPEHKMKIVSTLQEMGEIVSVTGDGVNDAPALKKANIGVAMGIAGTEVSKQAADMVLMDDSFATIVKAVREGRTIYDNIKKFVMYVFSGIGAEIFLVIVAMLLALVVPGMEFIAPITAIQILFVDLGTEVLPALALGVDKAERDIMKRKPRKHNERIIDKHSMARIILNATFIMLICMAVFLHIKPESIVKAQTMVFAIVIMSQMFNAYNFRAKDKSIFTVNIFSNIKLIFATLTSTILLLLLLHIPLLMEAFHLAALTLSEMGLILLLGFLIIPYNEIVKLFLKERRHTTIPHPKLPSQAIPQ